MMNYGKFFFFELLIYYFKIKIVNLYFFYNNKIYDNQIVILQKILIYNFSKKINLRTI